MAFLMTSAARLSKERDAVVLRKIPVTQNHRDKILSLCATSPFYPKDAVIGKKMDKMTVSTPISQVRAGLRNSAAEFRVHFDRKSNGA